jgi:autotransporter passenger strand-loop-strand repeat protein
MSSDGAGGTIVVDPRELTSGQSVVVSGATVFSGSRQQAGAVASTTVIDGLTLLSGAIVDITNTTVLSGGLAMVDSHGIASGVALQSGAAEYIYSGGSAVGGTVLKGGTEAVQAGGVETSAYISGGAAPVSVGGIAIATTIVAGGTERVSSGGVAIATVISSGGLETVLSSGMAAGATVLSGGSLIVSSGGEVTGAIVLSGGTMTVSGPLSAGTISFAGSGGELILDDPADFTGKISGMANVSQKLDLVGFAYTPGAESATWAQTGTSGTLTVSDGGYVAKLTLVGAYTTSNFTLSDDGHGGTILVDPPVKSLAAFTQAMASFANEPGIANGGPNYLMSGSSGFLGVAPLALQLRWRSTSESMGDHDSEVMACRAHRSRRRWNYGRLHCGM